jgi:excisionase family DNA binding protein
MSTNTLTEITSNTPLKLLINVRDASAALSISRSKFYELLQSGVIRTVKIGQRRLVSADSLTAYANSLVEAA